MKTKILTVALIFCMNLNGFAQKKDDDNKPCTRAQFAQLIVDTLPWVKELPDVNKDEINLLAKKGIIDQYFKPQVLVTRWELGQRLYTVVKYIEKNYNQEFPTYFSYWNRDTQLLFKDIPDCPSWAVDPVVTLIEKGIISGYPDGTFKGKQPATIKEVKLVLQRIKEKTEALLKEKELQNKSTLESSNP